MEVYMLHWYAYFHTLSLDLENIRNWTTNVIGHREPCLVCAQRQFVGANDGDQQHAALLHL
jgi:hypothetical protein